MSDEVEPLTDSTTPAPKRGRPSKSDSARALIDAITSGNTKAEAAARDEIQVSAASEEDNELNMLYDITIQRDMNGGGQDAFFGPNGRSVMLQRGVRLTVDAGLLECINNAVDSFYEAAPTAEDPDRKNLVQRMRYPYVLHRSYVRK